MTPFGGNTILLPSSQQLSCLRLGPLKGFVRQAQFNLCFASEIEGHRKVPGQAQSLGGTTTDLNLDSAFDENTLRCPLYILISPRKLKYPLLASPELLNSLLGNQPWGISNIRQPGNTWLTFVNETDNPSHHTSPKQKALIIISDFVILPNLRAHQSFGISK